MTRERTDEQPHFSPSSFDEEVAPPTHSDDGVDLTLIRRMLALSYEDRLEYLMKTANFIIETRQSMGDV